jgi:hypothetical protein
MLTKSETNEGYRNDDNFSHKQPHLIQQQNTFSAAKLETDKAMTPQHVTVSQNKA